MVCPYSLARPGGVQGQATGLARALRRLGHEVAVLAPGEPDAHDPAASFDGTHVVGRAVGVRANGSVAPVSLSPLAARRVERFARHHRADIVHLHEPLAPLLGYGCVVAKPAPLVGTFHRAGDSAGYRALRPLTGWAGRRLDVACAVSEEARRTAETAVGGSFEVLFNGVELERFADADPVPTDRTTVLFLGRHEERKGLAVLLEAMETVADPVELWVIGDGPDTEALRRRYPETERWQWLGRLNDEAVAARLRGAHILCAPSLRGESFGVVLLEAMAAGCAVVASDLPGYRAASGGLAELVRPGDAPALAQALTAAVADAAASTGRAAPDQLALGRAHAEGWSMDALARRYETLYHRALADGGGRGASSLDRP
jgi:phosphatidylinositol alpha-mannosyltransferase